MLYLGVDLGTSAVKLLLMESDGTIANIVSEKYPIAFPHPGWSEQEPADWWAAVKKGIPELVSGIDASNVAGISFGGQMHGLVVLDENDEVIRPAILWNDGRTQKETDYLNEVIGKEKLSEYTANIAFAGFTAPKILWMKENEPDKFARIKKIMDLFPRLVVVAAHMGGWSVQDVAAPLLWTRDLGKGRVAVCNHSLISGKDARGYVTMTLAALEDVLVYPIINAGMVYIDDFPAPQPEGYDDLIQELVDWHPDIAHIQTEFSAKFLAMPVVKKW